MNKDPKIISFATKKFEHDNKKNEALVNDVETRLAILKQNIKKYREWAQEARKLGDEKSAELYEEEINKIQELITEGEILAAEGYERSMVNIEKEMLRIRKELNDGLKVFKIEEIENTITKLQMDIDFFESDIDADPREKEIKINRAKEKIAELEEEKRKLEES